MVKYLPVYKYVHLIRVEPAGEDIQEILLVYHKNTKIILQQESPFHLKCGKCGTEKDDLWINKPLGEVMGKLMAAGWKETGS